MSSPVPITTDIAEAAAALAAGLLVAIPTETVYGLAAVATDPDAVRRIFAAKGRPVDHPLIVHLADGADLHDWSPDVPKCALVLAEAFWPGPLTVVITRNDRIGPEVTGGLDTVAVRVPGHPVALELLDALGAPLAAPSANRFGKVSPTSARDVAEAFGPEVALVLDGGPCSVGVESTIVDCTTDLPMILRHGAVTVDHLEEALSAPVLAEHDGQRRAPGMLSSHYAPECALELIADPAQARLRVSELARQGRRVGLLDPDVDVVGWAHHLYRWLRESSARVDVLVVVPPPPVGLGLAVNDRLAKAAAPRS